MRRDYGEYSSETRIINCFEDYEKELGCSFGDHPDDFMPWFECYRDGYMNGGSTYPA